MAKPQEKYDRLYVDDEIPAFMKAGPSRFSLNNLKSSNDDQKSFPKLSSIDEEDGVVATFGEEEEPPVEETLKNQPNTWNQNFLLTVVVLLVGLNALLFVSFNYESSSSKTARITLTSNRQVVEPAETLNDRVVTYRDVSDQFRTAYQRSNRNNLNEARKQVPASRIYRHDATSVLSRP